VTETRTDRQNYDSQDRASIAASRGKKTFCCWLISLFTTECDKYNLLTAVLFIGQVSAVIVSITDPGIINAAVRGSALELVRFARTFSCTRATDDTLRLEIMGFRTTGALAACKCAVRFLPARR